MKSLKIADSIAKLMEQKGKDRGKQGDHVENSLKAHQEPEMQDLKHQDAFCSKCGQGLHKDLDSLKE